MNKYFITKKTLISRLLLSSFLVLLIVLTYIVNKYGSEDPDGSVTIKWFMFKDLGLILTILISYLVLGTIHYIIIRRHKFYDDGDFFVIEKGLFLKKQLKLSYDKVNLIALKRRLIDLILKTAKVEIDSGSTASPLPEGKLPLNLDYAIYLKKFIELKKTNKELILYGPNNYKKIDADEENVIYKLSARRLFLMGLTKPGFLSATTLFLILITSLFNIGYITSDEITDNYNQEMMIFIFILIGFIGLVILTLGLYSLLKYYNYKLLDHGDSLEYEYGLFSKSNFKFKKNKIDAVYLKQSLLYRLIKRYAVEVSIIGLGDFASGNNNKRDSESKALMPFGNKQELEVVLNSIHAQAITKEELLKPKRHIVLNFIILPLILPTIILTTAIILTIVLPMKFYAVLVNLVILYILTIVSSFLNLKNKGVYVGSELLARYGMFTVVKVLVKKQKIQMTSFTSGPVRQLLKVGNVLFIYKGLLGVIRLKGYESNDLFSLSENLF